MLIQGTGEHSAPRWINHLRRVIVSVYPHSWGLDEAKGFPPLHSCEELFMTFASRRNQGLDTVYPLEYIIYCRDCLSDSFEKCTWSFF